MLKRIIWFNQPFNKNILINMGKQFLNSINKHFKAENMLHKIFNQNTLKLSHSCTKNRLYNKKTITKRYLKDENYWGHKSLWHKLL